MSKINKATAARTKGTARTHSLSEIMPTSLEICIPINARTIAMKINLNSRLFEKSLKLRTALLSLSINTINRSVIMSIIFFILLKADFKIDKRNNAPFYFSMLWAKNRTEVCHYIVRRGKKALAALRRLCFRAGPRVPENPERKDFPSGPAERVRRGRIGVEGFLASAWAWGLMSCNCNRRNTKVPFLKTRYSKD